VRGQVKAAIMLRMEFVADKYSYAEQRRREARRQQSLWYRHAAWIKSYQWPARVVIVIAEAGTVYALFVFGMVAGLVLWFASRSECFV
jgi:hypothetical protein